MGYATTDEPGNPLDAIRTVLPLDKLEIYKQNLTTVTGVRYKGNRHGGTFVFGEQKVPLVHIRSSDGRLEVTADQSEQSNFIQTLRKRLYDIAKEIR